MLSDESVKAVAFLRPSWVKLSITIALLVMSLLWVAGEDPTSMISWRQYRGFPVPFLVLGWGIFTSFYPSTIEAIRIPAVLVDIVIWYLVACLLTTGYKMLVYRE